MDREQLKTIIRNAPTIEATFAEVDAEFQKLTQAFTPLKNRRDALLGQITQIEVARAELGEAAPQKSTGESVPESQPTAKPNKQGTKK